MKTLRTLTIIAVIVSPGLMNAGEIKRMGSGRSALRLYKPVVTKLAPDAPVVAKDAEPQEALIETAVRAKKARAVSSTRKTGDKGRVAKLTNQYIAALDRLIEPDAVTVDIKVDRVMSADGKCVINSDVIIGDGEAVKTY